MWNQRKPNKTEIKPITVLRQDFNRAGLYSGQGLIVAGVNSAKGLQGFILVLSGFSWLLNACNERMWNQRKPNKTKIKPITVLWQDFIVAGLYSGQGLIVAGVLSWF